MEKKSEKIFYSEVLCIRKLLATHHSAPGGNVGFSKLKNYVIELSSELVNMTPY